MAVGLGLSGLFLVLYLSAAPWVLAVLTSHPEVLHLGRVFGLWLAPVLLAGAVAFVYDGLFLGLTAGRALRNAMLISLGAFLPVAWAAVRLASPHLLWAAMAFFMLVRALTLGQASRSLFPNLFPPEPGPESDPP
jgi:MATE family multidrug resistance protein